MKPEQAHTFFVELHVANLPRLSVPLRAEFDVRRVHPVEHFRRLARRSARV